MTQQDKLINNTIALNNVLSVEIKRKKLDRVEKNLRSFHTSIENIFNQINQEKFELLMLNSKSNNHRNINDYSLPFNKVMDLYFNIFIEVVQDESLSDFKIIKDNMRFLLKLISPYLGSEVGFIQYQSFMNIYFSYHRKIFIKSLEMNSIFSFWLSCSWYTNSVFNTFENKSNFNISFLDTYDKELFFCIRRIIDTDNYKLFKEIISYLHDGTGSHLDYSINLYSFTSYTNPKIEHKKLIKLHNDFKIINSPEELNIWLKNFEEIEAIILESEAKEEEALKIKKFAYGKYLFNNLKKVIHGVCAYLIYQKKYNWIKYIWEYKQPSDTSTFWISNTLYPKVNDLIHNYDDFRKFDFTEGHSDSKYYYALYEVYLLSKAFNESTFNFKFLEKDETTFTSIKYYLDEVKTKTTEVLKSHEGLKSLDIAYQSAGSMIAKCDEILQDIDIERKKLYTQTPFREDNITNFKNSFLEEYEKEYGLISIVKNYTNTLIETDSLGEKKFEIDNLIPREIFIREYSDEIDSFSTEYAHAMINGENRVILNKIMAISIKSKKESLDDILSGLNISDLFFVCSCYPEFIYDAKVFKNDYDNSIDIQSFQGWYKYKGQKVPLFIIDSNEVNDFLLVLDKSNFIEMEQYKIKHDDIYIEDLSDEKIDEMLKLEENDLEKKSDNLKLKASLTIQGSFNISVENYKGIIYQI